MQSEDKTTACKKPNSYSRFYRGKIQLTRMQVLKAIFNRYHHKKERQSQINHGNDSPWSTLSPQHTNITAVVGKLVQARNGTGSDFQLCVRDITQPTKLWMWLQTQFQLWEEQNIKKSSNGGKRHTLCVIKGEKKSTSPRIREAEENYLLCERGKNPPTRNPEREGEPPTMECEFL